MTEFQVAIVGSGPAGLSAAARAASLGLRHVLIERAEHLADTIQRYQRGKHVMATPDRLPVRSDVPFAADSREAVLERWTAIVGNLRINLRLGTEVTAIDGEKGSFTLHVGKGEQVTAETVVIAIGLQGNPRKLEVPGAANGLTEYHLADARDHWDKDIVVVGAGDSAIETAVALADNDNRVTIVNRKREFARAKPGNTALLTEAIRTEKVECLTQSSPARIDTDAIVVATPDGERRLPADRIIARIGAVAPRLFIEQIGGIFEEGAEFPRVSETYESDRPGIYYIGALAGYPLIKQGLNQGYEVIQTIAGQPVEGADIPLIQEKLRDLADGRPVHQAMENLRTTVELFHGLTQLQLHDLLLDAEVEVVEPGEHILRKGDAGDSLYLIARGTVDIPISENRTFTVPEGSFFGEMGLVMGRRRNADAVGGYAGAVVIELPRMAALKLLASSVTARRTLTDHVVLRKLQTFLSPDLDRCDLQGIIESYEVQRFARGETLIAEGEETDDVYVIKSGSCAITRRSADKEVVINYLPAGSLVGEMALLDRAPRNATVRAAAGVEAIRIDGRLFRDLLDAKPRLRTLVRSIADARAASSGARTTASDRKSRMVEFLMRTGIGEATNTIAIDTTACVRCDLCETACAETHDGIPRVTREAGSTFANLHIPVSCRHCEHPHCMADCPTNALSRSPGGAVVIDEETCIGCGNCARNCPYDAIRLAAKPERGGNLLSWLLFGLGDAPGQRQPARASADNRGTGPQV